MKHIIFDFDGTLANSMPVIIEIAEGMLGMKVTAEEIQHYRNMTAKAVLKEVGIPLIKVPGLLVKGRPLLLQRMNEVQIFKGLDAIIKQLVASEHKLYVVSSNSAGIINTFLQHHKLESYFSGIYGNVGLFSKAQALKKVMKREGFAAEDAIYIGDEVRDVEASKKVHIPIISVTWGYNGKPILYKYKPTYIAEKPQDITKIING